MSVAKEVVRAIIALVFGYFVFSVWSTSRSDPEYIVYAVSGISVVITFLLLHFIGKEN